MKPIHIVSKKEDISPLVLMPGDPLRAKYIAENYLSDSKLINDVRNMLGYTGYYKGIKITVIGSGMGIPSMGIYSYELKEFYDVKKIIRIGTSGSLNKDIHVKDLVVATSAKSLSTFAYGFSGKDTHEEFASPYLLENIKKASKKINNIHFATILTNDVFDLYKDVNITLEKLNFPNPAASEMETYGLYHVASSMGFEAATILTVVDSKYEKDKFITAEERETSLDEMIKLALEAIIL